MTEAGCRLILSRLDDLERHLERHLDEIEGRLFEVNKAVLTKAGFYQALIAAYAVVAAMYVGVFFACRAIISAG